MKPAKPEPAPLTDGQEVVARLYGQMDPQRQREVMRFVTNTMVAQWRAAPAPGNVKGGAQ